MKHQTQIDCVQEAWDRLAAGELDALAKRIVRSGTFSQKVAQIISPAYRKLTKRNNTAQQHFAGWNRCEKCARYLGSRMA